MKVSKITVKIAVEVLSMDSVPAIIMDVVDQIRNEKTCGSLRYSDGDEANWGFEHKGIEEI